VVLHDLSATDARFGVRRRIEHLVRAEREAGREVVFRSIVSGTSAPAGRVQRMVRALRTGRGGRLDASKVVVVALSAPHMVLMARLLAGRGVAVQLDVCDSVRLLDLKRAATRTPGGRLRQVGSAVVARVAFSGLPASIPRSYISRADAEADRDLSASEVLVIGPAPIPELVALPALVGRPQSVLAPLDATTDEGVAALRALVHHVRGNGPAARVEVTGSPPAEFADEDGIVWLGHVPTLAELYDRPCVVLSTNPSAHGVQNKLWEAYLARRPVVAFGSALHWAPELPWIHRVDTWDQLWSVLTAALDEHHDTPERGSPGTGDQDPEDRGPRPPAASSSTQLP